MAIWNGLPSWMGGQGSTSDTAAMDEQSDAYVKQLQAGWDLANQQMNPNYYGSLGNQQTAVSNWQNIYPITTVTTGVTGVATTTLPQYYPTPHYPAGSVYSSTGFGLPYGANVGPAAVPQSPNVGDKMIMEWDGSNWNTRYEPAVFGPKVAIKSENIEFSLDEIEEASQMIEKLSEKRLEHEAA